MNILTYIKQFSTVNYFTCRVVTSIVTVSVILHYLHYTGIVFLINTPNVFINKNGMELSVFVINFTYECIIYFLQNKK